MSSQTEINVERSGLWILASGEHDIDKEFLFFEMVSVIDDTIIDDLSDEADWRLSSILIKEWHVEIIHEIDESFAWWWSESSSGSLVNLGFNNNLKSFGVSVIIEIDSGIEGNIFVKSIKVILNDCCFTSTGRTNIKHTSSGFDMKIKKESLSSSFGSRYNHILEKTFIISVKWGCLFIPMDPLGLKWVKVEIKALTLIWEPNLRYSFP